MSQPLWRSLEINWPELRAYAPKIMPAWVSGPAEDRGLPEDRTELKLASKTTIRAAIKGAYDNAETGGGSRRTSRSFVARCGYCLKSKAIRRAGGKFRNLRKSSKTVAGAVE